MLLGDNHHFVNTDGKSQQQIIDMIFKEKEIREAKEREDRRDAAEKLAKNKADVTMPKAQEPKKAELATVPHPTAIGRAITKLRNTLHI